MSKLFYFIILSLRFCISSLQDDIKTTHKTHESKINDIHRSSDIPPKSKLNLSTWTPFRILQKASFGRKSSDKGYKIIIDSDTIDEVHDESIKEGNKSQFAIKVEESEPEEIDSSDDEEIFIKKGNSGCSVLASGTDYTQCDRYGLDIKKWRALLLESFSAALKEPERIQSFYQNIESLEELELYERRSSMTNCMSVNLSMDRHAVNGNFVILQPVETLSKKKSKSKILRVSVDLASKITDSMGQMKERKIDTQLHGSDNRRTVTSEGVSIGCKTTNVDTGTDNAYLMVQRRDRLHRLLVEESKDKIIQIVEDDCDGGIFADNPNNDNARVSLSFEEMQSYFVNETAVDFDDQKCKSLEHFNLEGPRHKTIQVKSAEQVFSENTSSDKVDISLTAGYLNSYNLKETYITSEICQCEFLHRERKEEPMVEAHEVAQCINSDVCFDDSSSNSINISRCISCILDENYVMQEQQIKGHKYQCDHELCTDEPKDDLTEVIEEGTRKEILSPRYDQVSLSLDQLDCYSLKESGIALSFDNRTAIKGLTGDLDQDEVAQLSITTMPADNYKSRGSSPSKDSVLVDSFSVAKKEPKTNKEVPKAAILTLKHLPCTEVEIKATNYMPSFSLEVKRGPVDSSHEFHSDIRKTAADYAKNKYNGAKSVDDKNKMATADCKIQTAQAVSYNETAISSKGSCITTLQEDMIPESNPAVEEVLQYPEGFHKRIGSTNVITPTEVDDFTEKVLLPADVMPVSKQTMNVSREESSFKVHSIISDAKEAMKVISSLDKNSFRECNPALEEELQHSEGFQKRICSTDVITPPTEVDYLKEKALFPDDIMPVSKQAINVSRAESSSEVHSVISDAKEAMKVISSPDEDSFGPSEASHLFVFNDYLSEATTLKEKNLGYSNPTGMANDVAKVRFPLREKENDLSSKWYVNFDAIAKHNQNMTDPFVGSEWETEVKAFGNEVKESSQKRLSHVVTGISTSANTDKMVDASIITTSCDVGGTGILKPDGNELKIIRDSNVILPNVVNADCLEPLDETGFPHSTVPEKDNFTTRLTCEDKFEQPLDACSKNDVCNTMFLPNETDVGNYDSFTEQEFSSFNFNKNCDETEDVSNPFAGTEWETETKEVKGEDKFQTISETVVPKLGSDDAKINTPTAHLPVTEKQDTKVTVHGVHDAYFETEFSEKVDTFAVKRFKRDDEAQVKESSSSRAWPKTSIQDKRSTNVRAGQKMEAASMSEKIIITKLRPCSAHRKPGSKSVSKEECRCSILEYITLPRNFSRTDVENIKRGNFQHIRVNSRYSDSQSKKRERTKTYAEDLECLRTSKSADITAQPLPPPPKVRGSSTSLKANNSTTSVDNPKAINDDSDSEEICTCTSQQSTLSMQLQHSVVERNCTQEYRSFSTREEYAGPSLDNSATNAEAKNDDSDCEEICTCTSQQSNLSMDAESSVAASPKMKGRLRKLKRLFRKKKARNNIEYNEETKTLLEISQELQSVKNSENMNHFEQETQPSRETSKLSRKEYK